MIENLDNYKLIIFDCDGTLVDSESLSNRLISVMMNERDIPMTEEQSMLLFKGTHFKCIVDYVQKYRPEENEEEFEKEFRSRCKLMFENELTEVKGAKEFIQSLQADYCVASNGPRIKMETSLLVTGIDKLLNSHQIFSAYDIHKFKPEPDLFLHAAHEMGFDKSECLVIEDTVPGIKAALSAGMDVWVVHHPGINDEVLEFGVPSFKDYTELKIYS